ncbi:hypothetical protein EDD11_010392 [Mortierella claussenii]|nr:hypothetical protein EDD11_010392 [Mortierella claussenii]
MSMQQPLQFLPSPYYSYDGWSSFCNLPEDWGPTSNKRFDLTLCFEFSVLFGALSISAILLFTSRIAYLKSQCKPHGLGRTAWIYWPTQICMGTAGLLAAANAAWIILQSENPSSAQIVGFLAMGCAWLLALFLNSFEHQYSIRSSDFIFSFYIVAISVLIIHARTLYFLSTSWPQAFSQLEFVKVMIGTLALGFIFEAWPRGNTQAQRASTMPIFEKANLFSQLTWGFYQPIISLSMRRALTMEDIVNQAPSFVLTQEAHAKFDLYWTRSLQKTRRMQARGLVHTPSLFRTILRAELAHGPAMVVLRLSRALANYMVPALLSLLLAYFQDIQRESASQVGRNDTRSDDKSWLGSSQGKNDGDEGHGDDRLAHGLFLVAAMFVASIANSLLLVATRRYFLTMGLEIRTALTSMVYRKSLRLSPGARQKSATGAIINHMSIDADQWTEGPIFLTMGISIPAEIAIGLWLLYQLLGWSAWVGLVTMIAISPLQIWRARVFGKMEREKWSHTDERIRLATEALSAIKIIKLYTWESALLQKILAVRKLELGVLKRIGIVQAIMSIIFSSSTAIICLATLSVFATWGGPAFTPGELTPQVVFVSMTLFAMLKTPISSLTNSTTAIVSLMVSTKRIQDFLLQEEIDLGAIVRVTDVSTIQPEAPALEMENATFSWARDSPSINDDSDLAEERARETQELLSESRQEDGGDRQNATLIPTLQDITLAVDRGSLIAVVGRVGQGKSSLLSAIIGELYKSQGFVRTLGRIAYVPQQAWILNSTLRENILFGHDFDEERYTRIVRACGLDPDIEMLPAGDLTEIGERGINLSGGQKQRVSLARAAYDNADIYLLDDPLSAVDAHVDHHLWTELIGPNGLLRGKTRLLVTHGIAHLKDMDRIVLLKGGRVAEDGEFEELMARGQIFYQLINEYSVAHKTKIAAQAELDNTLRIESAATTDSNITKDNDIHSQASTTAGTIVGATIDKKKRTKPDTNAKLIEAEKFEIGGLHKSVVMGYISALSIKYAVLVVGLHALAQLCLVSTNLWLKHWISLTETARKPKDQGAPSLRFFIFIFTMLTLAHVATCILLFWIAFAVARIRASEHLHQELMTRIMRLPPAFFDTTPLGRIINRVSSDMASIDGRLPSRLFEATLQAISLIASLAIVAATTPIFLIALPFIFFAYYIIQRCYLQASQVCKRIFQVTKSPIFQHFQETLAGVSTIRAMGLQHRFTEANAEKCDTHANAFVAYGYCTRWVEIQMQFMGCLIMLIASTWFVLSASKGVDHGNDTRGIDAATAGLALSFAMNISQALIYFTQAYCDLYTDLICVERVQELTQMKTEAPLWTEVNSEAGKAIALKQWPPKEGAITFVNYSTRYREGLDLVLRHVSFGVKGGEHIGIVGRTGAGKSSLTLALFRMVEAANSYWARASDNSSFASERDQQVGDVDNMDGGRIEIDGVDISTLGLADLRPHLAIIPQEPVLFAGSVRENLDPFQEQEDAILWEALERSHLKASISALPGGLSYTVAQNGENFSVGQRSLICLARALLRKSKILILDEATSAVDVETDELIQRTIRSEFKDRTILTIAHRIKTVMDSDRILVLEQGNVVEYDSPKVLVRDEGSLFYKLAKQAGEL